MSLAPAVLREVGECPGRALCVGCSGGSDSVALVHLLCERPPLRPRLVILHYDHALRPTESPRDREFVREMADRLHLPFFMESRPERPGPAPNEAELRALRLDFFHRLMAFHRTPYLLTAHHRDDALETLLLRLARGGNLDALTAPREIQKFRDGTIHLHPLLGHSKGDLRHYLRERAIPWCEDGTNAENGHTRNRVRNQLIPLWDSFEPRRNLKNSLWRSRQLLLEDGEALAELARATHGAAVDGDRLRIPPLLAVPTAIRRRVIHLYLTAHGRSAGAATVELILRALPLQKKCQITLAKNCRLRSDGHSLCLVSDGENFPA